MSYNDLPDAVCEHMLAKSYGWQLEYIKKLSPKSFHEHMTILLIEYREQIAGAVSNKIKKQLIG